MSCDDGFCCHISLLEFVEKAFFCGPFDFENTRSVVCMRDVGEVGALYFFLVFAVCA